MPVERLRDDGFGRYLIRRWEEAVAELEERCAVAPDLRNTDGDALLLTTDHFDITPGTRSDVEAQLAALEGAKADPDANGDPVVYVFLRPGNPQHASWENTLIGHARLSAGGLRLETNSRERADTLRERVEATCGERIRHRVREHTDPLSPKAAPAERGVVPQSPPPPEVEQLLLEFKQHHYDGWLDESLPALGGKTPREMTRTAKGRTAVDALIKDMENREQRSVDGAAFDFSEIRKELQLE